MVSKDASLRALIALALEADLLDAYEIGEEGVTLVQSSLTITLSRQQARIFLLGVIRGYRRTQCVGDAEEV